MHLRTSLSYRFSMFHTYKDNSRGRKIICLDFLVKNGGHTNASVATIIAYSYRQIVRGQDWTTRHNSVLLKALEKC